MTEVVDITISQGETFIQEFYWKDDTGSPLSVDGGSARMQIRSDQTSSTVILELSTANGKITLGDSDGRITLALTSTETAALTWSASPGTLLPSAVYDLFVTSASGKVSKVMKGKAQLDLAITR